MPTRREFLLEVPALASLGAPAFAQSGLRIRQVDIVHHTHTDVGYTDYPAVVRDKQKRFLDMAMDLCRSQKSFRWTVESLVELDDWWKTASRARRDEFLRLVNAGLMDVMGMPFNQTAFLNAMQWKQMMHWIPESLWKAVNPRAAMQNDVNGFPRAGAAALLDRGIGHLLSGLNTDSGGSPMQRPVAFWWKQPDGRKLFVWLGDHYGRAMTWLDVTAKNPLRTDEPSLSAAHTKFVASLKKYEAEGYDSERLILTFTHPAAYDNGSPYPPLAPFVEAWNKAGLQPVLRIVTATKAVLEMEKLVGARAPVYEGEWTDWWTNGTASGPRELSASRFAKRFVAAAVSPVWGPLPAASQPEVESILKDLCLFDEHTWGASQSIGAPYSLNTQAQYVQKSDLAYRPMGFADWLLKRRAKTKLETQPEGTYVVNPSPAEVSGWGSDKKTWVEKLGPREMRKVTGSAAASAAKPVVQTDGAGWPVRAQWPGMAKPIVDGALGDFLAVEMIPPANRRTIIQMHQAPNPAKREELRRASLRQTPATYGAAKVQETPHTILYTQEMRHARLSAAARVLELWRAEPRLRVTLKFDRLPANQPEVFYVAFALPQGVPLPVMASGGRPFTPYRDQLKESCRDYYANDGWAHYRTGDGEWLWSSRDSALTVIGGPHTIERHLEEPADKHRVLGMIFDNCWHTNFVADSHGTVEFQFDLVWRPKIERPAELAEALSLDPMVLVKGPEKEDPAEMNQLYRP